MTRRAATFRQADITRAVKGVVAAGMNVERVEVDNTGKIIIHPGDGSATEVAELDKWRSGRARTI